MFNPNYNSNTAHINIKIVGIGGGGNNVIKTIAEQTDLPVELIAINTDYKLLTSLPDGIKKLHIGKNVTNGLGTGGKVELGEESAKQDIYAIKEALKGADMVFFAAGLGAGTGTGALPIIAQVARELKILSIGVVTVPFAFEGRRKQKTAEAALEKVANSMDALVVVHNDNLLKLNTQMKLSLLNAFKLVDDILIKGIRCVSELILTVGTVNVDFADVKSIFTQSTHPDAILGVGESNVNALEAVKNAINSPLLERKINGAQGIILNITGNSDLTLFDVNDATCYLQECTHPEVNIIFGIVYDDSLEGTVRASIIATDFADNALKAEPEITLGSAQEGANKPAETKEEDLAVPDFLKGKKEKEAPKHVSHSFFQFPFLKDK